MKITTSDCCKENEIKYPCLMQHTKNGAIVLVPDKDTAVVLKTGDTFSRAIGEKFMIAKGNYVVYKGSITLCNDD